MADWMGVRLMISRSALSAAIFTESSDRLILNKKCRASLIFQNTVQSASTMFSSPVSICLSRGLAAEAATLPPPSCNWLTWVTFGSSTVSMG